MDNTSEEIRISYETLFELLVRERTRAELQKLPGSFFKDIQDYLKQKESAEKNSHPEEQSKIQKEIENIRQIIKDLYNKREKKIVLLALDKSRTQSSIVNTSLLLAEEKGLFDELVHSLDSKRMLAMERLSRAPKDIQEKTAEHMEKSKTKVEMSATESSATETKSPQKEETNLNKEKQEQKGTKLVRFVHAVPAFLGLEGEEYGPFEEEDVASLPSEIVGLLVKKERVEEIEES